VSQEAGSDDPTASEDCDFCRIARGKDPDAHVICEGETWVGFLPLEPATLGHTLVIPREHVSDVWALGEGLGADLMAALVHVGKAIRVALKPDGLNLISSAGAAASQTVFHLHFHLVPRRFNDRMGRIWPPDRPMDEEITEDVADVLRSACADLRNTGPSPAQPL
jgi:histidine triad (HIT) family protein